MKKKLLTMLVTVAGTLLLSSVAYCEALDCEIETTNDTITVSGSVETIGEIEGLALEILKPNTDFDTVSDISCVAYANQLDLKQYESEFSFVFPRFAESGLYKAKLVRLTDGETKEFEIRIVEDTDFSQVISELKGNMGTQEQFSTFLGMGNNAFLLNCDTIPLNAERAEIEKYMYSFLKTEFDSVKSTEDMKAVWCGSILTYLLNDGIADDLSDLDDYVYFSDKNIESWFKAQGQSADGKAKIMQILKQKRYDKYFDLVAQMKRALILSVVKSPNGISNIGEVMADFSDISGVTQRNEVEKYRQIAGMDFTDFDIFIEKFKGITIDTGKNSGSSGTSGGGGSGGYVATGQAKTENGEETPVVSMNFIDLDTVPWAYEAISTLTDLNVINGRSSELFEPNEFITREEFVKICVNILKLDSSDGTVVFSDEVPGEWYCGYLKAAYDNKLVLGNDDGSFGVGANISRQDMAVIIYNTIKDSIPQNTDRVSFDDADVISDYASDAVEILAGLGIINGTGDNMFSPLNTATRAEAAKMAFGILEYV